MAGLAGTSPGEILSTISAAENQSGVVLRDGETPTPVRLVCRRLAEAIAAARKPRAASGRA